MKIRLMGLPQEVNEAADRIKQVLDVINDSGHLRPRGDHRQVSVYLDVRL
ncbi:hypothetical protein [Actinoallomurus sp. CA-150999]